MPSSKSHRGPGCGCQTDAQATRQAWRQPLQSPRHAGSGHQRLLVSRRARPRVSAHRHRCVCTPGACAPGLARTRPSSASGVLSRARSAGGKCALPAAHFLPASPAIACLRRRCLRPPPAGPQGLVSPWWGKQEAVTPGGQGGTLAVIHAPACVSGLDLGCGLGDGSESPPPCLWGCVVWGRKGRGWKTRRPEGRVAGLFI